ncbi:MAG: flavin reductase [Flavobacteriales bacterium]|nr:flavin reductase [Flavobacteriales bacterium]
MIWHKTDLQNLEQRYRGRFVNSLSGVKSANLIGTANEDGLTNLAVFTSVVHLGANPAMVGMVMRPTTVERHTWDNIIKSKVYTINHVHENMVEGAHQTAARYSLEQSEFDHCGFTTEMVDGFHAPAVKESKIKYGVQFQNAMVLSNGCKFIVGDIQWVMFDEELLAEDGYLNIEESIGVGSLDGYHSISLLSRRSYSKVGEKQQELKDWKKGW